MKKLLGISLVALFAVSPMMAKAADLTSAQMAKANIVDAGENEIGDAKRMAAVSYVKGAYTELGTAINTKQDKISDASVSTAEGGDLAITVAESAGRLSSVSASINSGAVTTAKIADEAVTLDKLSTAVQASLAAADAAAGGITTAVNALDATVSTANDAALAITVSEVDGKLTSVTGSINDSAVTTAKIADEAVTLDKLSTAVQESLAAADAAAGALESALTAYTTTSDLQSTYATQSGVLATINSATISGTVPVLATWGSDSATSATIDASISAPNAYQSGNTGV